MLPRKSRQAAEEQQVSAALAGIPGKSWQAAVSEERIRALIEMG